MVDWRWGGGYSIGRADNVSVEPMLISLPIPIFLGMTGRTVTVDVSLLMFLWRRGRKGGEKGVAGRKDDTRTMQLGLVLTFDSATALLWIYMYSMLRFTAIVFG